MTCLRIPNGVICVAIEHEVVDANGKPWLFEMNAYFGPLVIGKRGGEPLATQPGPRSPFWPAFDAWFESRKETP